MRGSSGGKDYYIYLFMFNLTMIFNGEERKKRSTVFLYPKDNKNLGETMHAAIWKYRLVSRRKACGNKGVVGAVLFLGLFSQD